LHRTVSGHALTGRGSQEESGGVQARPRATRPLRRRPPCFTTHTPPGGAAVVSSVLGRNKSWAGLVSGGVTALAVPERVGGDGVGLPELATALTEIGRHGRHRPERGGPREHAVLLGAAL